MPNSKAHNQGRMYTSYGQLVLPRGWVYLQFKHTLADSAARYQYVSGAATYYYGQDVGPSGYGVHFHQTYDNHIWRAYGNRDSIDFESSLGGWGLEGANTGAASLTRISGVRRNPSGVGMVQAQLYSTTTNNDTWMNMRINGTGNGGSLVQGTWYYFVGWFWSPDENLRFYDGGSGSPNRLVFVTNGPNSAGLAENSGTNFTNNKFTSPLQAQGWRRVEIPFTPSGTDGINIRLNVPYTAWTPIYWTDLGVFTAPGNNVNSAAAATGHSGTGHLRYDGGILDPFQGYVGGWWQFIRQPDGANVYPMFLLGEYTANKYLYVHYSIVGGNPRITVICNDNTPATRINATITAPNITSGWGKDFMDGKPVHVGVEYGPSGSQKYVKIYINGEPATSLASTTFTAGPRGEMIRPLNFYLGLPDGTGGATTYVSDVIIGGGTYVGESMARHVYQATKGGESVWTPSQVTGMLLN